MGFGWDLEAYTSMNNQIALSLKPGKQLVQEHNEYF